MLLSKALAVAVCASAMAACSPQQVPTIGSIATRDALVSGGLQVQGEHAQLLTSASVTAYGHTAPLVLTRGGDVLVCSTSRFHVLRSGAESSLIFALDRGAIEIHSDTQPQDVIMTPDLRMTFASAGPLDLRLRVTSNGDTCVENTGRSAPQISISDAFSDSSYRLRAGQHVLFEHGSIHEVVDQELSPCGCPAEVGATMNVAENSANTPDEVAARNPFPAAVSQGLAPETKPVATAPARSELPTEGANSLTYTPPSEAAKATQHPPSQTTATPAEATSLAPPSSPPGAHDVVHAIGRFFHKLFHGGSASSHN